ncbi:MAG: MFS transporter [bacterium]|nr:MFS transporter [bacterium]
MTSTPQDPSKNENSKAGDTHSLPSGPRRAAIAFILVTVVLDVLSLTVTIPVVPKLIEGMVFQQWLQEDASVSASLDNVSADACATIIDRIREPGNEYPDARAALTSELGYTDAAVDRFLDWNESEVVAKATFYSGLFGTAWALMQFVFSPLIGALSDRFGRRKVILISCAGLGIDYILMALAPNLIWLFIGRLLSGITAASFATASAYIADVTPPAKRAATFGLVGAAWGFGFVFGPFIGAQLGVFGLRLPFWVAAVLTLLNAFYGLFILPESLPAEKRSEFSLAKANPLGALRLLRSHTQLFGFAVVLLLYQIAHQVFPSVFVFYAGYRYAWGLQTIGWTLMVVGLMSVFMQGFVIRKAAPVLGEKRMLFTALSFGAAGYMIYGLASNGWLFWSAIPVFAFVGFFNPAIQGLMTRRVSDREQGQLQGANSSLMGIAGMIGPIMFTSIFKQSISGESFPPVPGAPFFLATLLHCLAIAVAILILRHESAGEAQQQVDG